MSDEPTATTVAPITAAEDTTASPAENTAAQPASTAVDGVASDSSNGVSTPPPPPDAPSTSSSSSTDSTSLPSSSTDSTSLPSSASPSPSSASTSSNSSSTSDTKPSQHPPRTTTTRRAASLSTLPAHSHATPSGPPQPPPTPFLLLSVESPTGRTARVEATPSDLLLEVRHFLLSCPETCEYTQYHLTHAGVVLNDYAELGVYDGLMKAVVNGTVETLKIVPDVYDERGVRMHVRRVRELLRSPPHHVQTSLVLTLDELQEKEKREKKRSEARDRDGKKALKKEADDEASTADHAAADEPTLPHPSSTSSSSFFSPFALSDFFSHAHSTVSLPPPLSCLQSLTYSAFNPPPGNRRLRGDLLYLTCTTLESHTLHITAAIDGFYVNSSTPTHFSPTPAPASYSSHTLIDLLRKASPLFAGRFGTNLSRRVLMHPFQLAELVPGTTLPTWLAKPTDWQADDGRAEDALLASYGMDVRGVVRDWNEEYQSCLEMQVVGEDDRVRRDGHLHRVYSEFVQAAVDGAVAIVEGHIAPVNALDPARQHVWIFNAIFFSTAVDSRDMYPAAYGDRTFHKQAGADLHGVELHLNLHVPELHTLATALVDYRGHRLIAQSIIPGIFHTDRASKHVYGSMDQGETVLHDGAHAQPPPHRRARTPHRTPRRARRQGGAHLPHSRRRHQRHRRQRPPLVRAGPHA